MRNRARLLGLVALLGLWAAGCVPGYGPLTVRDSFEATRSLAPDGRFTLENTNGEVQVATWDQDQVRVEAELRAASESQLRQIAIEVQGEGDRVSVNTRLPRGGFFGHGGAVDYHITLPRHARLEVKTVNGRVSIEGLEGRLLASTVNGGVEITDAAGEVHATTVNGSIRAQYDAADDGQHRFETTNGSVTVTLPDDATGRFEAHTVNGSISTDFPLTVEGRMFKRHLEGRLGDGRGSYQISTVNGAVRIRKG